MIFKKYEFTDEAAWQTAKTSITTTDSEGNVSYTSDVNAVAEIGYICYAYDDEGNCENLSTLWSVDILWNTDSDKFLNEAVYPSPDDVVHTFAGDNNLWVKTYCTQYPEYCETPEEE
mgnify:FL=1|jgi:hypothetical protein